MLKFLNQLVFDGDAEFWRFTEKNLYENQGFTEIAEIVFKNT